ncbi:MAG: hypothetical protein ACTS45_01820 [Candidatus Hodgkinia cicadicola]
MRRTLFNGGSEVWRKFGKVLSFGTLLAKLIWTVGTAENASKVVDFALWDTFCDESARHFGHCEGLEATLRAQTFGRRGTRGNCVWAEVDSERVELLHLR